MRKSRRTSILVVTTDPTARPGGDGEMRGRLHASSEVSSSVTTSHDLIVGLSSGMIAPRTDNHCLPGYHVQRKFTFCSPVLILLLSSTHMIVFLKVERAVMVKLAALAAAAGRGRNDEDRGDSFSRERGRGRGRASRGRGRSVRSTAPR